jgi:hypothetical protein
MLELTMYGLVGLAAMLVIAFYFAYRDESARPVAGSALFHTRDPVERP